MRKEPYTCSSALLININIYLLDQKNSVRIDNCNL